MKYFKMIYIPTGTVMCYGSCEDSESIDDVLGKVMDDIRELYGEDQYGAKYVTKEEFEQETGERDENEELLQEYILDSFMEGD